MSGLSKRIAPPKIRTIGRRLRFVGTEESPKTKPELVVDVGIGVLVIIGVGGSLIGVGVKIRVGVEVGVEVGTE